MIALPKFAPDHPSKANRSGATRVVAVGQLAGRDSTSRPASFSDRQHRQLSASEKHMRTYTRGITVNPATIAVKNELAAWAKSAPAKVLSIRTGISQGRIYDWRSERFGANAATLEVIRNDKVSEARRQIIEARAVIRQSLGAMADLYPDAIDKIMGDA
jgi:hypothetical protein